ncbi:MAG: type II toxin-antitoxin system VapC family toxin [Spirochaetales bacterium]|nr:type II toxin-antitoxin system VapC family toxin [Spirochaetales bacterium]
MKKWKNGDFIKVRGLLDTCTLLWLVREPDKLSVAAKNFINDTNNSIMLSHVSIWEILLKQRASKIHLPQPPRFWIQEQAKIWKLALLPLKLEHLYRSNEIENHHSDPFDRLLISQCYCENVVILTPDTCIRNYSVPVVW